MSIQPKYLQQLAVKYGPYMPDIANMALRDAAVRIDELETQVAEKSETHCWVPREATQQMTNAAVDATGLFYTSPDHTGWRRSPQMLFEAGYVAMLKAAEGAR